MAGASSTVECAVECIAGQNPFLMYFNYFLIGLILISILVLVLFRKKLSIKQSFLVKAVLSTSIILFLLVLAFASSEHKSVFHIAHQAALISAGLFFVVSYLLSPLLMKVGMKKIKDERVEKITKEEALKLSVSRPEIIVFLNNEPNAFVVSGYKKIVFISTGLIGLLEEEELRAVIKHELMHLKSSFFNIKRFFSSVRAGTFGLLPIHFEELDILEEINLDEKMGKEAETLNKVREKL
jgi:Zn-dependent protease with chaperone function